MHDAGAVRAIQRVGDLRTVFDDLGQRERAARQPVGQTLPLQHLHHQKADAVLMADVIEGADVRMVELRNRSGLTVESLLQSRI